MKIVFLGSGNVATHMASALKMLGHEVVEVYSRKYENAQALAVKIGAQPIDRIDCVSSLADLYVFSVKDDVLAEVIAKMPHSNGIWVHTAGSVPMSVFSAYVRNYGVIYPLQTFSKQKEVCFSDVPLFLEGSSVEIICRLEELANELSNSVHCLSGQKRAVLHLAAVFASNFANHMYSLAGQIVAEEGVPFDVLRPLIAETTAKAMELTPWEAQTGPAVRGDQKVMKAHMELLKSPEMKELYALVSESIYNFSPQ